ncbi:MAG: hypothetical protein Q8P20_08035 [bacterium]|nr:hypothetical protein [bacterium]MDZ4227890.1 hypothetical protein [Candidatus Levybacteria bacterium]
MIKKRGQAGIKFLMTYSWGLLVVLIALGSIFYFGIPFEDSSQEEYDLHPYTMMNEICKDKNLILWDIRKTMNGYEFDCIPNSKSIVKTMEINKKIKYLYYMNYNEIISIKPKITINQTGLP